MHIILISCGFSEKKKKNELFVIDLDEFTVFCTLSDLISHKLNMCSFEK